MSWLDVLVVGFVVFFIWTGYSRGMIMEFFEFMIFSVNVVLSTHLYGFLSNLFVTFIHTPSLVASVISYLFFFSIVAVVLWVLAGKSEIAANIPPSFELGRLAGAFFAFVKAVLLAWAIFFGVSLIPLTDESKLVLHNSPTVHGVQSITLMVDSVLETLGSSRAYHTIHPLIQQSVF